MSSSHGADDSTDDKKIYSTQNLYEFLQSDPKTEAILAKNLRNPPKAHLQPVSMI